jgi:hypothetical protein
MEGKGLIFELGSFLSALGFKSKQSTQWAVIASSVEGVAGIFDFSNWQALLG